MKLDLHDAQGFIFDCDGTILYSVNAWLDAENTLIEHAKYPVTEEDMHRVHASPIKKAAAILASKYGPGTTPQDILNHFDTHLLDFYRNRAEAFIGVEDFLLELTSRGIPCVVVSSSPHNYLEAGLGRVGLLKYFDELISACDVNMSKRSPEIYEYAIDRLGADPSRLWGVDDAYYALEHMKSFGLTTIAPESTYDNPHFDLVEKSADYVIKDYSEIEII